MRTVWTGERLRAARKVLRRTAINNFREAIEEIEQESGEPTTADSLRNAFIRAGFKTPSSYCKPTDTSVADAEAEAAVEKGGVTPAMQKLFKLTKSGAMPFGALCDKLDMSPARAKDLIEKATAAGMQIRVEQGHVGIVMPVPDERIRDVGIHPVVGKRQKVAVISDIHLGSKYCMRKQLQDFVQAAYAEGVREVLCPGDVLDGDYRHGKFEMSHMGLDAQTQDLFEVLPKLPGLTYHCITGNHDFTFTEQSGVDVGQFVMGYFRERGREDIHFYGNRGAFLKIRGAVVHLWHPRSGVSYARSYAIQKHIEKYASSEKPHILLCGHWHVYCHVYERGVHGIACPTFQGGGSAFSKSLGGAPAIGGLILSWGLTEDGTMREFALKMRAYFEKETPVRIEDRDYGIPVHVNTR